MKLYRILIVLGLLALTASGCSKHEYETYPDFSNAPFGEYKTGLESSVKSSDLYSDESGTGTDETSSSSEIVSKASLIDMLQIDIPVMQVPLTYAPETEEIKEEAPQTPEIKKEIYETEAVQKAAAAPVNAVYQPVAAKTEKVQKAEEAPKEAPKASPTVIQTPETEAVVIKEEAPAETEAPVPEKVTEPEVTPGLVTVLPLDVYGVILTSDRRYYKAGESASVNVAVHPSDAASKDYTLSIVSGNAEISGHTILLSEEGSVTIRATCGNGVYGEITFHSVDVVKYAEDVLKYINIERSKLGINELSANDTALSSVSSIRVNELVQSYSHIRSDGSDCYVLYDEKGVDYTTGAENIAKGFATPEDMVSIWLTSPGHRRNILNPQFKKVGIGIEMDSNGILYWTQNFAD